jgi:hypothetical protein
MFLRPAHHYMLFFFLLVSFLLLGSSCTVIRRRGLPKFTLLARDEPLELVIPLIYRIDLR